MRGMYINVFGNVSLATLKRALQYFFFFRRFAVSLSLILNDSSTTVVDIVVGVMCLIMCAACAIFAPGSCPPGS